MSEIITKYKYTDEDGDICQVNYIQRFCMCSCDCYSNILELEDDVNKGEFYQLEIEGRELKYFVKYLLDNCLDRPSEETLSEEQR